MARLSSRPLVLFGARGRLGSALAIAATRHGLQVEPIHWQEARDWLQADSRDGLRRLAIADGGVDVIFAGGLTDPGRSSADLTLANVQVPARVIEATAGDPRFRFMTIGSVLETLAELAQGNRYLASKADLWRRVSGLAEDRRLIGRIAHLRLHTLYGGTPAAHSFLGQILESIRAGRPFAMSDGLQLREYSHVEDVAESILALLAQDWRTVEFDLSTGRPVRLRDLAKKIFEAFGCSDLLRIGAVATPKGENIEARFAASPPWLLGQPRDPVGGIIDWLANLLNRSPGAA